MYELQATIFAIGSLVFAPSLIGMLWKNYKSKDRVTPLSSSLPTAAVLWIYVVTYLTMDSSFMYAAITSGMTATMWTLLMLKWKDNP